MHPTVSLKPVTPVIGVPDEEFSAIKAAGYTDQHLVDISLVIAVTIFMNVCNRINDTAIDFTAVA
jgi:alkylhydroperoxidase family enzyme